MQRLIAILLTIVIGCASLWAALPRWEVVDVPARVASVMQSSEADAPFEVFVNEGCVYIVNGKSLQVKVFTILGQLISQESLSSGSHRLRISSRGVYILKVGESTIRITI